MNSGPSPRPFTSPLQGEVWWVNLDPTMGHEQAGQRPAVIVSANQFNRSSAELVFAVPTTTVDKGIVWHVRVDPPEGNFRRTSYIKCEDLRPLSTVRLVSRWGSISPGSLAEVSDILRVLLGL